MKENLYSEFNGTPATNGKYYVNVNGEWRQLSNNNDGKGWFYQYDGQNYYVTNSMGAGIKYEFVAPVNLDKKYNYTIFLKDNGDSVLNSDDNPVEVSIKCNAWRYYDDNNNPVNVSPENVDNGSTNQYRFYKITQLQFYTQTSTTKIQALVSAANSFVTSVHDKSPDSRIGVVSFADNASYATNKSGKNLLRVGNDTDADNSYNAIQSAITDLDSSSNQPSGATRSDLGLQKAADLFREELENTGSSSLMLTFPMVTTLEISALSVNHASVPPTATRAAVVTAVTSIKTFLFIGMFS